MCIRDRYNTTLSTLIELFEKLDQQTTHTIHQHLLEQINSEEDSIKRRKLATVLLVFILNAKSEFISTQVITNDLLQWMKAENNPYIFAALAPNLEPQTTQTIVQGLLDQINIEKNPTKHNELYVALQRFTRTAKLNSKNIQIIFNNLPVSYTHLDVYKRQRST